jgi:asparagine N-glycosylation enzyme membrane subunit Stt3
MRYSIPGSLRDLEPKNLSPELLAQVKLSVLLGYGFAFSLIGVGGLASLVAFVIGWQARGRIKRSHDKLVGMKLAWWCIVVGIAGAIILPLVLAARMLRLFR